jgi:hypothetical protein
MSVSGKAKLVCLSEIGRIAARQPWAIVGSRLNRISAKLGKQIAHDVTNCRKGEGASEISRRVRG